MKHVSLISIATALVLSACAADTSGPDDHQPDPVPSTLEESADDLVDDAPQPDVSTNTTGATESGHSDGGFQFSAVGTLGDVHAHMLTHGLPLVQLEIVTATYGEDQSLDMEVVPSSILWAPPGADPSWLGLGESVVVHRDRVPGYVQVDLPAEGVGVVEPDGTLIAMAVRDTADRDSFNADFAIPGGPFFLALATDALSAELSGDLPNCVAIPGHLSPGRTDVEALTTYFSVLDGQTWKDRQVEQRQNEIQLEARLENLPPAFDAVTGEPVGYDLALAADQVGSGVPVDQLTLHPSIALSIDAAGFETSETVLIWFEDGTDRMLGWLGTNYLLETGDAPTESSAPTAGRAVKFYLRSGPDRFCPPSTGESPLVVVPFDSFAGTKRARIELSARTYTELAVEELTEE